MPAEIVDEFVDRFRRWAERAPDVQALAVIGSHARSSDPADEWSDVDLVIVADDPDRYLSNKAWLDDIGQCRLTFVEESPLAGLFERRAHFDDGCEFDLLVITPAMMEAAADLREAADLASRGWRVLVDKKGLTVRFAARVGAQVGVRMCVPDETEIADAAARFWHGCIWTARKLRRGELWVATLAVNDLHRGLLTALEWEACTRPGAEAPDVWFRGRFLERWADPRIVRRLEETFVAYDANAVLRSLRALAELYSEVVTEVAARVGSQRPHEIESYGRATLESILGPDK